MTVIIVRAEIAFAKTANRCCSAVKKTFVNWEGRGFVGTVVGKGMDDAGTRTKGDRRLVNPFLETTFDGLINNHTGRERFWSERQIVADAHRATYQFDVAAKPTRRHVDCVPDEKATWVDIRALTEIERVRQSNGVHLIIALPQQEVRSDFRIGDLYMPNGEDKSSLVIFCNLTAQFQSSAQFKFCVAVVIESESRHTRGEHKICVKKERHLR